MSHFDGMRHIIPQQQLVSYEKLLRKKAELLKANASPAAVEQLEREIEKEKEDAESYIEGANQDFARGRLDIDDVAPRVLKQIMATYKDLLDEIPQDLTERPFSLWRRHIEKVISVIEESLTARGAQLSTVQNVVAQATSAADIKAELILGLMQAREEKKKKYPVELHGVIDREYGKAIDKVRRES